MDQTFGFRAARAPLHRRVSPRAIGLAVAGLIIIVGLVAFSRWVVVSEQRSRQWASTMAEAGTIVGTMSGDGTEIGSAAESGRLSIDSTARADVRTALVAARRAAS